MKIDSIKLSGWRSYNSEGIYLDNLKSINIIIGPNNSGKSNLSKYFHYLKTISVGKIHPEGRILLESDLDESQTWSWKKNNIYSEVSISKENSFDSPNQVSPTTLSFTPDKYAITLSVEHLIENQVATLNYKINDQQIFNESGAILRNLDSQEYTDATDYIDGFYENSFYWKKFINSLVFVDPIRHHSRSSENQKNYYFDGAMIISELNNIRSDSSNKSKWLKFKKQMIAWLSDILSEKVTSVDVSPQELRLEFRSDLIFTLDELGTGVSQVVMLLSHLWVNQDKSLNIFLEEPEANLHPESVIKLVKIFENELSNHTFFITTHSPSLIDCINENWAAYGATKSESGCSKITPNDNIIKHYETLDSLGVKASQILQANTVIWVEGPSDRIYLKKWIEFFSDHSLVEGKDFSFLYFGGTNLASFSTLGDQNDDFINILSTSRKAFLVTDSDCPTEEERKSEKFKTYLSKMIERVEVANTNTRGIDNSVNDYFKTWVSSGREIENYICKDLLFTVLTDEFKRISIGTGDKLRRLKLEVINSSDFVFDQFDSFDTAIANCYIYDDDQQLDSDAKKNIALSYANKKVQIAKAISNKWSMDQKNEHDLEKKMTELIGFIRG